MRPADDAVVITTDHMALEEVVDLVLRRIETGCPQDLR
jgi:cytidylate kinase